MPHLRDHYGSSCGMEVVLANGEVMRTGMGALPGSRTWQEYRYGFGPDPAGLSAQGNFGIVTKMGLRLMPQPEHYLTGMITVPRRQDFVALIDIVNHLSDSFLCGEAVYASPLAALNGNAAAHGLITNKGGPGDTQMDALAAEHGLPSWQVELQFYGPEPDLPCQLGLCQGSHPFQHFGRTRAGRREPVGAADARSAEQCVAAVQE